MISLVWLLEISLNSANVTAVCGFLMTCALGDYYIRDP